MVGKVTSDVLSLVRASDGCDGAYVVDGLPVLVSGGLWVCLKVFAHVC